MKKDKGKMILLPTSLSAYFILLSTPKIIDAKIANEKKNQDEEIKRQIFEITVQPLIAASDTKIKNIKKFIF